MNENPTHYKCVTCGEKLTAGIEVYFVGNGDLQHIECPKHTIQHAKLVMKWWVKEEPVLVDDLVGAARVIINKYERLKGETNGE